MNKIQVAILALACSLGLQASAATIAVTYSFDGGPVGPEVPIGTILTVDHFSTGSVLSANPSLNTIWNPVTYLSHDVIDLTTGLLNGAFTMTFADGNTLSGQSFRRPFPGILERRGSHPSDVHFHRRNRRICRSHRIVFG